jgi:hypothetical protein
MPKRYDDPAESTVAAPEQPVDAPDPQHVSDPVTEPEDNSATQVEEQPEVPEAEAIEEAPKVKLVINHENLPEGVEPPLKLSVAQFEDVEVPAEGVEVSAKHAEALGQHPFLSVEKEDAE